jgi:hypothetical protein
MIVVPMLDDIAGVSWVRAGQRHELTINVLFPVELHLPKGSDELSPSNIIQYTI